jgi:hypothetical protein
MKARALNRRRFLRGLGGVSVGLPLLEAWLPRRAEATAASIKRFLVFFTCNGVNMDRFFPTGGFGAITDSTLAGTALEPLTGHASRLLVPRGIHQVPIGFGREGNGDDHQKGMGTKLTAQDLDGSSDNYAQGESVDQTIARQLNPSGREPLTLQVGRRGRGVLAHISYRGPGQPVTGENNPWLAYRDFMGIGEDDPEALAAAERIARRRESVLDLVTDEFESLKASGLGQADREKLDLHFSTIRELETGMTGGGTIACSLPDATETELMGIDADTVEDEVSYRDMGRLSLDVMALAVACDHTRVASIQWGTGAGGPIFRWDGMNHEVNHHKLSHGSFHDDCFPGDEREKCQNQPANWEDHLHEIDRWHAERYAYLLDRLAAYTEGAGSVLDNSLVVWANELSDGRAHHFANLPWVIAGSAGGYLKQGQHLDLTAGADLYDFGGDGVPHNRLLLTFANAMGLSLTEYGDSQFAQQQGELTELKV